MVIYRNNYILFEGDLVTTSDLLIVLRIKIKINIKFEMIINDPHTLNDNIITHLFDL